MRFIYIVIIVCLKFAIGQAQTEESRNLQHDDLMSSNGTILDSLSDFVARKTYIGRHAYMMPMLGYNDSDSWMLGMYMVQQKGNSKKGIHYRISPFYSFDQKQIVGMGNVSYMAPLRGDRSLAFSANFRSFHEWNSDVLDASLRYIRISPKLALSLHTDDPLEELQLFATTHIIDNEFLIFDSNSTFLGKANKTSVIPQLGLSFHKFDDVITKNGSVILEYQKYGDDAYLKATATYEYSIEIAPKKQFYVRSFIAGHIFNSQRNSNSYNNIFTRGSIAMIQHGFNDYTYSETFLGRQNQDGFQDNQISMVGGGGFKTAIGSAYSFGMSNNYAAAINARLDIPFFAEYFPLSMYFDVGTFATRNPLTSQKENNIMFNGGLSFTFFDVVTMYLPLVYSNQLHDIFVSQHEGIFSRITFSIRPFTFNRKNITINQFF